MAVRTKQELLNYINSNIISNQQGNISGSVMNVSLVDIIDSFYSSSANEKIYILSGVPSNALGNDNDTYLDDSTFKIYKKGLGVWVEKLDFNQTFTSGIGIPVSTTMPNNSHYVNSNNLDIYKYDLNTTTWNLVVSNPSFLTGSGVPTSTTVSLDSHYIDTDSLILYKFNGTTWDVVTTISGTTFTSGLVTPTMTTEPTDSHYMDTVAAKLYKFNGATWDLVYNFGSTILNLYTHYNVYVDDNTGDDSTGEIGNKNKPFRTPWGAKKFIVDLGNAYGRYTIIVAENDISTPNYRIASITGGLGLSGDFISDTLSEWQLNHPLIVKYVMYGVLRYMDNPPTALPTDSLVMDKDDLTPLIIEGYDNSEIEWNQIFLSPTNPFMGWVGNFDITLDKTNVSISKYKYLDTNQIYQRYYIKEQVHEHDFYFSIEDVDNIITPFGQNEEGVFITYDVAIQKFRREAFGGGGVPNILMEHGYLRGVIDIGIWESNINSFIIDTDLSDANYCSIKIGTIDWNPGSSPTNPFLKVIRSVGGLPTSDVFKSIPKIELGSVLINASGVTSEAVLIDSLVDFTWKGLISPHPLVTFVFTPNSLIRLNEFAGGKIHIDVQHNYSATFPITYANGLIYNPQQLINLIPMCIDGKIVSSPLNNFDGIALDDIANSVVGVPIPMIVDMFMYLNVSGSSTSNAIKIISGNVNNTELVIKHLVADLAIDGGVINGSGTWTVI